MAISVDLGKSLSGVHSKLIQVNSKLGENLSRLSSGKGINKSADNAAGLAIAEQLSAQIKSTDQAIRNVSAGSALLRTAEGGLGSIGNLLSRGRELALQASNGTISQNGRTAIGRELTQIKQEIDRISGSSEFNGQKTLNGDLGPSAANKVEIQAGTEAGPANRIAIDSIRNTDTQSLGVANTSLSTTENARNAITQFDSAISQLVETRANVGALEGRFQNAVSNLQVSKENLLSAETQIRGLDYAKETASFATNKALIETGLSSLQSGIKSRESLIGGLISTIG